MSSSHNLEPDVPRDRLAAALERLLAAHVLLPIAIISVALAGFVLGRQIDGWVLPMGALLAIVCLRVFSSSWRDTARTASVAAVAHGVAGLVASAFPDNSWDGLAYHQEAVLRLADGWNPLFEGAAAYGRGEELWLDHYPKGSWIAAAAVLLTTGHVEAGKLFNLTLMLAASGMVTLLLLRTTRLRIAMSAALGILTALNPVFIYQATTFYVDNLLASALTLVVAGLTLYASTRQWRVLAIALAAACLAINVKLTGLVYVAVILAVAVPAMWWWHGLVQARRMAAAAAATAVVGGGILGYAPYVQNLRDHADPFYPATPTYRILNMSQTPANLQERDRITRFFVSSFSRSEAVRSPQQTRLKFPLWVGAEERRGLYGADLEAGGFGPLYGASLLLALVGVVTLCARRATRQIAGVVLLIGGTLLASMFVHGQTWWARFVPQAWLLPMLVAIPALSLPRRSFQWCLGVGLVGLTVANLLIVGANVGWRQLKYARENQRSLLQLAAAPGQVNVYLSSFRSLRQRLREADINFRIVEAPPESGQRHPIPTPGNLAFWFESP
jgi:hypothetical protein